MTEDPRPPDDAALPVRRDWSRFGPARRPLDEADRLLARFLPPGAVILTVLGFAAYAMGYLRDRIQGQTFGAGTELDAFKAAFFIPDLVFAVIVASGVAAPFIPVFTGLKRTSEAAAHEFAQTILTVAVLVMGTLAAGLFVIAPLTVDWIAPGFDAAQRELYTDLFRVMLLTPIIFAASLTLGEVLLVERRFVAYGLAPILYNAGLAGGTVLLSDDLGIFGPAIGAIVGALLHLGIRLIGIRSVHLRVRPRLAVRTRAMGEFVRLTIPKIASGPLDQLTFGFFTRIASTLAAGSIVAVDLARNFQSAPVSLIGITISLAAFPTFARAYAAGDRRLFTRLVARNAVTVGVLTGLAAIALAILSHLIIDRLLGGGEFDAGDVDRTALVLTVFALSVPFESLGHLLSRAIYATHHTLLQVVASLVGFAVTVALAQPLVEALGIAGIPLSFGLGSAVRCVLLAVILVPRIRRMPATPPEPVRA
ncbi:MAG TPA: lipid II flippase MurJ [Clostridia bacterium]|nr:lipid II flippase MurJ [Clostridia bacterium]